MTNTSHVNPVCPICGKILYQSVHHARAASGAMGNRIRVYQRHGGYHVTKQGWQEYEEAVTVD